ncbi:hypothetical protein K491DRAFT_691973 [Lophiostoma macrostomum CBS 122681]|uniref:Uncharacterized protein n=1 Tax=Lophiostoma macrostomum CBS 122681 TaxID=1314788 RepID=A0A6A6TCT4_9PLEO|nr:hypothetical protein K491DRAFT_691973 [Lophiostoma macrostomum CBS 122681]
MATPAPEAPGFITLCLTSLSSPSALNSNTIHRQASGILNTISLIRRDIDVAKSLLFPLIRAKVILPQARNYSESVITNTEKALQNAQLLVEPLRLDQAEKGRFSWGNKARWAAMDKRKLHQIMGVLLSHHQVLLRSISDLQHITSRGGHEEYAYMAPTDSVLSRPTTGTQTWQGDASPRDQASPTTQYSSHHDQDSYTAHAAAPVTYAPSSLVEWKRKSRQISYTQAGPTLELSPQLQRMHLTENGLHNPLDQRHDNTVVLDPREESRFKPENQHIDQPSELGPKGDLRYKPPGQRLDSIWETGPESNLYRYPGHVDHISELSSEPVRHSQSNVHRPPNLDETYLDYSGVVSTPAQPRVELNYTISSHPSGATQENYEGFQVVGGPSHDRHQSLVVQGPSYQAADPSQGESDFGGWGPSQGSNVYTYPAGDNANASRQTWNGASSHWQN